MTHLVVSTPGTFIGKTSERLVIRRRNADGGTECTEEIPLFRLNEITIESRGVAVSTDALEECVTRGIRVSFIGRDGSPWGVMTSPFMEGAVKTRREQYEAYRDRRSVILAREWVCAKIANQRALLLYYGKYAKKDDPDRYGRIESAAARLAALEEEAESVSGMCVDEVRAKCMGIEGASSAAYWDAVSAIVGESLFSGRAHRAANDPFNASLNYAYGILYSRVTSCLINAGLDLYAGFLHADRPGKPSLVFDFIEEFRQPAADRAVISIFNKNPSSIRMEDGLIECGSRKFLAGRVIANLEAEVDYRGRRCSLGAVMQKQARLVAAFLLDEAEYRGYRFKW